MPRGSFNGIQFYSWDWSDKAKELGVTSPTLGVIAQEIQETYPDAVREADDGYLMVDYSKWFGDK